MDDNLRLTRWAVAHIREIIARMNVNCAFRIVEMHSDSCSRIWVGEENRKARLADVVLSR